MWGWFSSIGDWFESLWEATKDISSQIASLPSKIGEFVRSSFDGFTSFVTNALDFIYNTVLDIYNELPELPSKIGEFVRSSFDGFTSFVTSSLKTIYNKIVNIFDTLKDLPETMLSKLKELFIPDSDEIKNTLDTMVDNISSQLGIQFNTLDRLFQREVAPEDVEENYTISGVGTFKLKFFDSKYLIQGVSAIRPIIRGFIVLLLVLFVWRQVMSLIGQDPSIAHNAQQNFEKWKGDKKE